MSTFEAFVQIGSASISVSASGTPVTVESRLAAVRSPNAVLTIFLPYPADAEDKPDRDEQAANLAPKP